MHYCNANRVPFLAQNGGSGWIGSFHLGSNGVVISLHGLNQVSFNTDRTQTTIGGGSIISEVINRAYENNAQLATGNCNCVGVLGAILGGGYGNLMGIYGFGVDTLISLTYVNAKGKLLTITAKDVDLWWAFRGSGPNFGIVTSAVVQSRYVPQIDSKAWLGGLVFTGDKLESVVSAIDELKLEPKMNIFLYFIFSDSEPVILLTPFYFGEEAIGRQKFASILAIGPVADTTAVKSYNHWNDDAEIFCIQGDRKPAYGAGMLRMRPTAWRAVWNEYVQFTKRPGTQKSTILMEAYSLGKGREVPDDSASFPYRQVSFNAAAIPWYSDASLDQEAQAFGRRVRDIWWNNDDMTSNTR